MSVRALVTGVLLTVVSGAWVRQSEIATLTTQITESVPVIPGLATLALLVVLNALLARIPGGRAYTRGEVLTTFLFVTVATAMMSNGVMQFLFALITAPFYFASEGFPDLGPLLPEALAPHDPTLIRRLYERAPDGVVPWASWCLPGAMWCAFFLGLWVTLYCLMALFYRAWSDEEKLAFPLVLLPLEMTAPRQSFFRSRVMWAGFGLSALYNLVNIVHALYPSVPAPGKSLDFSPWMATAPWDTIGSISFHFRPELIGLGYLVSTNISLTIWLSFFANKLAALGAGGLGYESHDLYPQEQGIGAYLALALLLTWQARRALARAGRIALANADDRGPEGISYRTAFLGLIGGFGFVWAFATWAGMAWWVSLAYLLVVVAVALVYGRIRAQTGVPLVWLFPFSMPKAVLLYTLGSAPFVASGAATVPAWGLFTFLSRGFFLSIVGYQTEGMELARRAPLRARALAGTLLLAVVVGFAVGWANHLFSYYTLGGLHREDGIWGSSEARQEFETAVRLAHTPQFPEPDRVRASVGGGVVALTLHLLQARLPGMPLSALGYAMTCSFGDLLWGPFLIVWICKGLVLRFGGMALYRRTVPFFLGFALGHFAVAGVLWGGTGAWAGDAIKGYQVFFG